MLHYFYPRPPRGGRRTFRRNGTTATVFLSTPSARRATYSSTPVNNSQGNFYPRPPRGGRPGYQGLYGYPVIFLSTPSARRATVAVGLYTLVVEISIHALREEGDSSLLHFRPLRMNFYPRPPRGGRPIEPAVKPYPNLFLSTPSARRATCYRINKELLGTTISIHALREEGDPGQRRNARRYPTVFLSTPSARRATAKFNEKTGDFEISIHALREEGDIWPNSRTS